MSRRISRKNLKSMDYSFIVSGGMDKIKKREFHKEFSLFYLELKGFGINR